MLARIILIAVLLTPVATAESWDLSGGVFIAHAPAGVQFSASPPEGGWCQLYADSLAITSCEQQVNRIDSGDGSVWYVLAAWDEAKEWCGTEFGFGSYDAQSFAFVSSGPCFPSDGLEIPTSNWPGPNEGVAITTTDEPWSGNFEPVYYFTGYAYYEDQIPLSVDPDSDFGGWANCDEDKEAAESFGAMGLLSTGEHVCPSETRGGEGAEPRTGGDLIDLEVATAIGRGEVFTGPLEWTQTDSALYLFGHCFHRGPSGPPPVALPSEFIEAMRLLDETQNAARSTATSRSEFVARVLESVTPHIGTLFAYCRPSSSRIDIGVIPGPAPEKGAWDRAILIPDRLPASPFDPSSAVIPLSEQFRSIIDTYEQAHELGGIIFFGDTYEATVPSSRWEPTMRVLRSLALASDPDTVDCRRTILTLDRLKADWLNAQREGHD